ncbi:hypothetical protein [Limosilactobacillus portuensis]|uniref:hypothetical protein n=1 Tax=Limosilactobacillus portuensis TaxID=2742601 RepID=UPI003263E7C0
MNDSNKKAPRIKINGEAYKMINVLTSNGELIASISAKDVIHDVNYQVQLIKAND